MQADISPENEQSIRHTVETGMFPDRSAALDAAVGLLRRREQLIRDVNHGIEQLERGERVALDIEKIKAEVRAR